MPPRPVVRVSGNGTGGKLAYRLGAATGQPVSVREGDELLRVVGMLLDFLFQIINRLCQTMAPICAREINTKPASVSRAVIRWTIAAGAGLQSVGASRPDGTRVKLDKFEGLVYHSGTSAAL